MTDSDAKLKRDIAANERRLALVKPDSWTAQQILDTLAYLRAQLALPRDQRCHYESGSLD